MTKSSTCTHCGAEIEGDLVHLLYGPWHRRTCRLYESAEDRMLRDSLSAERAKRLAASGECVGGPPWFVDPRHPMYYKNR